jgi:hypothetical protein
MVGSELIALIVLVVNLGGIIAETLLKRRFFSAQTSSKNPAGFVTKFTLQQQKSRVQCRSILPIALSL